MTATIIDRIDTELVDLERERALLDNQIERLRDAREILTGNVTPAAVTEKKKPSAGTGFECGDCGRSFGSQQALGAHSRAHKSGGLSTNPDAVRKRRQRDKAKVAGAGGPFVCDDCGKEFSRPNGLSRHRNQTHGSKPLATPTAAPPPPPPPNNPRSLTPLHGCDHCDERFYSRADVRRHRLDQHADTYDDEAG